MKVNIKVLYNLIPSCLVVIARHAQSTQNNEVAISQDVRVEVDGADEHQSFLQAGTVIFNGLVLACLKYSKNKHAKMFALHYLKKEGSNEVDFLHNIMTS